MFVVFDSILMSCFVFYIDKMKKKIDKVENIQQMQDIGILGEYYFLGLGVEIHEINKQA
jgi:hypothetical protein